jgi:hypothetical protein
LLTFDFSSPASASQRQQPIATAAFWKLNSKVLTTRQRSFITVSIVTEAVIEIRNLAAEKQEIAGTGQARIGVLI